MLVHYDTTKPLVLATDASQYGIGAMILHRMETGEEHHLHTPRSKSLTSAEKKTVHNLSNIYPEIFMECH